MNKQLKTLKNKLRILVMSHAHPDFSLGGGEIAAYNLFKAYQNHLDVEEVWFLARADKGRGATGLISLYRNNEYLWEQSISDWTKMKAGNQFSLNTWFEDFILALKPNVVHSHHYAHLGLEYLRKIKQINPNIKIMFTLHEYMAICQHNGQMVKTGKDFKLCYQSSLDACHNCYPNQTPENFWLRKHYFLKHFESIDFFISPSYFLKERYVDWGIKDEKISVIENGQTELRPLPARTLSYKTDKRNRFGYFGQINPYKGLKVILEAMNSMNELDKSKIVLEIHGANLEYQNEEFQQNIQTLLAPLLSNGSVRWFGSYQPHELRDRMKGVDWVVVPSIWWENSPMVIQEALVSGRPVLLSNIGGMKEKIRDGIDGFHVSTGSAQAWADIMLKCAELDIETWESMRHEIQRPITYSQCADMHVKIIAN